MPLQEKGATDSVQAALAPFYLPDLFLTVSSLCFFSLQLHSHCPSRFGIPGFWLVIVSLFIHLDSALHRLISIVRRLAS